MNLKPIRSKKDYQQALAQIDSLWDAKRNTPDGDALEILSILVEKYEETHFPIAAPDPIEAIKFRMEQQGLTQADMAPYLGGANRVSEVLRRKRKLTVQMIKSLYDNLHIPAESLIGQAP